VKRVCWVAVAAVLFAVATIANGTRSEAVVRVTITRTSCGVSPRRVEAGDAVFRIMNRSGRSASFSVAGRHAKASPGRVARLAVSLKAGRTAYSCSVAGHRVGRGFLSVSSAPQPVPEQFLGVWNRNITESDVLPPSHLGVWSLSFDRSGVVVVYEPVGAHVPGVRDTITSTFSATANGQLVVGAAAGCANGTYRWAIVDVFLRIEKVSDDRPNRVAVIPGDWAR
jgi:hypothetical protein